MNKLLICFLLLSVTVVGKAQSYTISGFVSDAASGEKLIYASVYDEKFECRMHYQ